MADSRKSEFHREAARYYAARLQEHGPTPAGVDWNSASSQQMRFRMLLELHKMPEPLTIVDYGCGYGALADYLELENIPAGYQGYDISPEMIETAWKLHASRSWCLFTSDLAAVKPADYAVASGIFNVKQDAAEGAWRDYILDTIHELARLGERGFAFNSLTSYSDKEKMRDTLYYADPCFLFDYCKRNFSRHVALLHDYGLYEFTILVRRDPA